MGVDLSGRNCYADTFLRPPPRHTTVLGGMWWCVMVAPNGSDSITCRETKPPGPFPIKTQSHSPRGDLKLYCRCMLRLISWKADQIKKLESAPWHQRPVGIDMGKYKEDDTVQFEEPEYS
jgi:hypothetical protein